MSVFSKADLNEILYQREVLNKATEVGYVVYEPGEEIQAMIDDLEREIRDEAKIDRFKRIASQHSDH